jgi:hypothetical protein
VPAQSAIAAAVRTNVRVSGRYDFIRKGPLVVRICFLKRQYCNPKAKLLLSENVAKIAKESRTRFNMGMRVHIESRRRSKVATFELVEGGKFQPLKRSTRCKRLESGFHQRRWALRANLL